MCGLFGAVKDRGWFGAEDYDRFGEATDLLRHRGPDDSGRLAINLKEGGAENRARFDLFLGHRRLSILDLSSAGHQPFSSPCGRYLLAYNGELYNYRELQAELKKEGYQFRSRTDTEVFLYALMHWREDAFARFNGMWAAAFVDLSARSLILSRDRFGEKPLYYFRNQNGLYFSSEIKAICAGSRNRFRPEGRVIGRFVAQSLLNAQEETFFQGISQVPAGHCLVASFAHDGNISTQAPQRYWVCQLGQEPVKDEEDLAEHIRELFLDAVRLRLQSDVPVGALLSGGVDSSAIASAIYKLGAGESLNMFSAVSDDPRYDERRYIRMMEDYLGKAAHKVNLFSDPAEAMRWLEQAIWFNDQPVGDYSSVAHLILMHKARELGTTVILSGQGADELLCGYLKYQAFYLQDLLKSGRLLKCAIQAAYLFKPPMAYLSDFKLSDAKRYLPSFPAPAHSDLLGPRISDPASLSIGLGDHGVTERQLLDVLRFSVPALTHYEDRMSMAASREIRLPFLDHRLAGLLLPLDPSLKLRRGWTKWIFRKAMAPLLPRGIAWRRDKKGFSNPVGEWLKKEWKKEIEAIVHGEMVSERLGLINRPGLQLLYKRYCNGQSSLGAKDIFNPLALEIWARQYREFLEE